MTTPLYDENAYLSSFEATVLASVPTADGRFDIVLDRTAFFPEQGGQTADCGTLNGTAQVLDAHIREGVIHHLCDAPLPVGSAVTGELDFARRFSHMQQHTGEHILSGLCAKRYGCRNVGFHLSDHIVTVDYDRPLTGDQLDALEDSANRSVWDNLPVRCWYPTAEEAERLDYRSKKEIADRLRIVSIPGVDDCACCAPHVRFTGEVGLIKIMSAASYKGGVRLSILCGGRALAALRLKHRRLEGICRRMTCGEDELAQILDKRDSELKDARLRMRQLESELLYRDAVAARARGVRLLRTDAADMPAMLRAAGALRDGSSAPVGVFAGNDADGYTFCLMGGESLQKVFAGFRRTLNAQGGGDRQLIRGKCAAGWAAIVAYLTENPS